MGFKHATGWGGDGAFFWGERTLRAPSRPCDGWADCGACVTSKNGDRSLWIDYIFHGQSWWCPDGQERRLSAGRRDPGPRAPSDHLPLACTFRFS